ncbi:alanine racemase [Microcella daejeonensis]|uniref:alanine racemase n=1 Tax=Microcella daejeonensis TaxID=2994971 RepID=UPI00227055CA|nr:alanine racemase [Microcella daejeonensis]WAB83309.1 alanine racemase [Microcella daejeonensis]
MTELLGGGAVQPSPALVIDHAALIDNLRAVRARVAPAELILVVKDDAYGQGLAPIIATAVAEGITWFGVSDLGTALEVRELAGRATRVLAWPAGASDGVDRAVRASIDLGVGDAALLETVAAEARAAGAVARIHLKIDTGLHRNGFRPEDWAETVHRARVLEQSGFFRVVGVWSHIAEASDAEDDAARALFDAAVEQLEAAGMRLELRHLAASAAAFARPEFRYDAVRIGAFCYGVRSAEGPGAGSLGLRPVATLQGTVVAVHDETVTVALGSLDGVPSTLAGRVAVGTPAGPRELLRVDADSLAIVGWPGAAVGDVIAVFGSGMLGERSATSLAEAIGTIGEEILLRVSPRIPRLHRGTAPVASAER